MRKPSEYLPAAVKGIRGRLMPDCSETLRQGERSATVTRVGTTSRGEEALTDSDVVEGVRVLALAADFPDISKGRLVSLSGTWRIVTAARTDPACATLSLGLSAPLDEMTAAYRRPGTQIRQPLHVLAVESDVLEAWADNLAPTASRGWFVAFASTDWLETTDPRIGDELTLDAATMRVASVAKHDGYWLLTCRSRR